MSTVPHTDTRIHRLAPGVALPEVFAPGDRIHIAAGHSPSASTIERLRLVHAQLVKAVRQGDILLFRAYFDDPANPVAKAIYDEAKRP